MHCIHSSLGTIKYSKNHVKGLDIKTCYLIIQQTFFDSASKGFSVLDSSPVKGC